MGRAPCCEKNGLKKGPWTPEEDQKLIDYIQEHGYGNWRTLPKNAGLQRCGKSCRLRWTNYLRPDIKRGKFSFEEEEAIIQLHSILGNKWSAIAARLPGRTDNEIKNYWNTHIRKKLLKNGIDPVTHSPRLDLLDLNTILNSSLYANYPNSMSQMNFSRLLGLQSFVNPELVRLASSLFSPQRQISQGYHMQNNNLNLLVQNQNIGHNPQVVQTPVHNTTIVPGTACLDTPACKIPLMRHDDILDFQAGLGMQNCSGSEFVPGTDYGYYGSGQTVMDSDPSSDQASTIQSSNNFSVPSNTFSHSSSSAPLNSNYGEDVERESYCSSNLLKFDIPDVLDFNDFL